MNPVFSLVERDGGARSVHMPNVRVDNLGAVLGQPCFAARAIS